MLLILLKVKTGYKILETTQPVPHDPLPIQNKWCLWAEMKVHLMPSIMKIAVAIFTAFLNQYPFGQFFFSKPLSKKKKKRPDDWEVTCEGSHPRPPGRAGRPDV